MKFSQPLLEGRLLKRYKRFFADIDYQSQTLTAHVPNTGSLKSCLFPEAPCLFEANDNPARKLKYTLMMVKTPTSWVGVHTGLSNHLVYEAWQSQSVEHWKSFDRAQLEVKISPDSRVDLVLWNKKSQHPSDKCSYQDLKSSRFHFVEVKNVTLCENQRALFPDAVTTRGQKHIEELMRLIDQGHSAEFVFTVQREDCKSFSPADDIDPAYGRLLRQAQAQGLKLTALACKMSPEELYLDTKNPLKIEL